MSKTAVPPLGVLADDFTGALDAGAEFVRAGLTTTLALRAGDFPADVLLLNTDSREVTEAEARQAVEAAASRLHDRRVLKKIDSTLRGHVAAEIEATLHTTGAARAVVCPAVVEAGRVVRDGCLYVGGVPLHESAFKDDPRWPARTSQLGELLGRPATHFGREVIALGAAELARQIVSAATPLVTVDAESHHDLDMIGAAIRLSGSLPCGALGLARAWLRSLGHRSDEPPALPERGRGALLVLAGSRHPRTRSQVATLLARSSAACFETQPTASEHGTRLIRDAVSQMQRGRSVVISPPRVVIEPHSAQRKLVETLGSLAARICERVEPAALVALGGETASALCAALDTSGVELLGQLDVGVPVGRLRGGAADERLLVTKAGGFGRDDLLLEAERRLCHS